MCGILSAFFRNLQYLEIGGGEMRNNHHFYSRIALNRSKRMIDRTARQDKMSITQRNRFELVLARCQVSLVGHVMIQTAHAR